MINPTSSKSELQNSLAEQIDVEFTPKELLVIQEMDNILVSSYKYSFIGLFLLSVQSNVWLKSRVSIIVVIKVLHSTFFVYQKL